MAEPIEIAAAIAELVGAGDRQADLGPERDVTSGPTHEPIDPVRYIANRSSGKQGYAIAAAAADAGADVTLISGPVNVPDPLAVKRHPRGNRTRDAGSGRGRVAGGRGDFRRCGRGLARGSRRAPRKSRKAGSQPELALVENPDILSSVSPRKHGKRPKLVIGFAAETEKVIANAQAKLARKGCDWIIANDVSPETGVMGGDRNTVHLVTRPESNWPEQSKEDVAKMLIERIASTLGGEQAETNRSSLMRLPHAPDLPMPPSQTPSAAGSISSPPCLKRADENPARRVGGDPTGLALALPPGTEGRCGHARGLRPGTASPCSTRRERSTRTIAGGGQPASHDDRLGT